MVQQGQEGILSWCWPLRVQRGPLDQPLWGCNLGAMGTDVGAEVIEEYPSAGEWVADWKTKHIAEPRDKKRDGSQRFNSMLTLDIMIITDDKWGMKCQTDAWQLQSKTAVNLSILALKWSDMVYKCCSLPLPVVTGSDSSPICRCSIEQRKENIPESKERKKAHKVERTYITITGSQRHLGFYSVGWQALIPTWQLHWNTDV